MPARSDRSRPGSTVAVEDYLKAIYSHGEWQSAALTPSELANRLRLAPSSVTEMVKKLAELGLVHHAPYGSIELTEQGLVRALLMVRRHRLLEAFLVNELGYDWDEVHDEAEHLEHVVSDRFLAAIDQLLGFPERDPHGDVIPSAEGTIHRPDAVLLNTIPPGQTVTVFRISDQDPALLRWFSERGIVVDTRLTVLDAALRVRVHGGSEERLDAVADSLWVCAPEG